MSACLPLARISQITLLSAVMAMVACASDEAATTKDAPMTSDDKHDGHHTRSGGKDEHAYEHHGGHHRFDDPEQWAKRFENPERDAWQKPEAVLDAIGFEPAMFVADIGSATGYFPVRVAKRVPQGRVWGVDIEAEMVRYLNARAAREGLDNLKSIQGTPTDPKLPEPVDVVMMVNTYHHIADRPGYFQTVGDKLKPGGRVAIVDFKMGDLGMGPPEKMKIAPDRIISEMLSAGYVLEKDERELLEYQVLLVFRRP